MSNFNETHISIIPTNRNHKSKEVRFKSDSKYRIRLDRKNCMM